MKLLAKAALVALVIPLVGASPAPTPTPTPSKKKPRLTNRPRMLGRLRANLPRAKGRRRVAKKKATAALPPCEGMDVLAAKGGPKPFSIGEELGYELSVAGAYVGRFETKVGKPRRVQGKTVIPLFGRARTSSFVSSIQSFSGRYMSMVDPSTLRPLGLRVESKYGDDDRWERVAFSDDLEHATVDYRMKGRERKREWNSNHRLTDLLSMLYAARSVRITPGLVACQDVFGARRLWRMDAQVVGIEDVRTPAGKQKAYRVKTKFLRKKHHTLSSTKRPNAEIDVYFAADGTQTPLKFVVKTQGIEATGRLVRWSLDGTSEDADWGI